jgi:hypothetical protein
LRPIDRDLGAFGHGLAHRSAADAEADPRRVRELLDAVRHARVKKAIVDDAAQAGAFGLAPPACRVQLSLENDPKALTLRLGRVSPVSSLRYAASDADHVVLTDGSLYDVVSRRAEALRERRLIPVDPETVTRILVERPEGRLALAQVSGAWRLEEPIVDVASPSACATLARAIAAMEIETSPLPPPKDVARSRRLRVAVTAPGATNPHVAVVAAAGIEGRRVAFREGAALAGTIPESAAGELQRPWESFRETRIASFSVPDVRELTIEHGAATLRVVREGESSPWLGSDGSGTVPVEGARVIELLERLRGLSCDGFAAARPTTSATGTIIVSGEGKSWRDWCSGPSPARMRRTCG